MKDVQVKMCQVEENSYTLQVKLKQPKCRVYHVTALMLSNIIMSFSLIFEENFVIIKTDILYTFDILLLYL